MDLPSAFHHEPCHFGSKIIISSDVTVTVRIRFSSFFLQKPIISTLEIGLAKFEVIPTNRSRVWTYLVHFTTNIAIFESKMTSQWQSEPDFHLFLQKSIMSTLEICLAKFEIVRTNICRVWTCLVHFTINLVIFESKVTSQ